MTMMREAKPKTYAPASKERAAQITTLVQDQETATSTLRTRMREDEEEHYRVTVPQHKANSKHDFDYKSNRLRQNADRLIAMLRGGEVVIRSEVMGQTEERQQANTLSEDFFRHNLQLIDRHAARAVQPASTLGMFAYSAVVRGWVSALHMYARIPQEVLLPNGKVETVLRSRPLFRYWDPYNVYWSVGEDGELDWICRTDLWTQVKIEDMYPGLHLSGTPVWRGKDPAWPIYEFYDRHSQYLVADGKHLKPPVPHGARNRVPASIIPVGSAPMVNLNTEAYPITQLGQSAFDALRGAAKHHDAFVNIAKGLMMQALQRQWVFESLTGDAPMEGIGDMSDPGNVAQIIKDEQTLNPLDPVRTTVDFDKVFQVNRLDYTGSMLPRQVFGDMDGQRAISGYQQNLITLASTFLAESFRQAIEMLYVEAEDCMRQMYTEVTPAGQPVHDLVLLQGQPVDPLALQLAPPPKVELKLRMPGDDVAKVNIARQLTEGELPLMSVEQAQDEILEVPDPEKTRRSVDVQMMRRGNPLILIQEAIKASQRIGDTAAVEAWEQQWRIQKAMLDLQEQQLQQQVQMAMMGMPAQVPGGPEPAVPGGGGQMNGAQPTMNGNGGLAAGQRTEAGFTQASRGQPPREPDERQSLGGRPEGSGQR